MGGRTTCLLLALFLLIIPGKNTGVSFQALLRRIFPTQGWNLSPAAPELRPDSLPLSHWEAPGSSAVSGPRAVRGVEQGSLTVRCRYDPGYEPYVKWWCRGADLSSCRFVVKTNLGSEKEVKQGRVSIKDNWKDRSFTVTMEKLRLDDSDTYRCGIERVGVDLWDDVDVTIDPAPTVSISTRATSNANMFMASVPPEENQGQLWTTEPRGKF